MKPIFQGKLFHVPSGEFGNYPRLGLAIVNTIITDHQGFVRVRDNDPCGTRFIIELPAG